MVPPIVQSPKPTEEQQTGNKTVSPVAAHIKKVIDRINALYHETIGKLMVGLDEIEVVSMQQRLQLISALKGTGLSAPTKFEKFFKDSVNVYSVEAAQAASRLRRAQRDGATFRVDRYLRDLQGVQSVEILPKGLTAADILNGKKFEVTNVPKTFQLRKPSFEQERDKRIRMSTDESARVAAQAKPVFYLMDVRERQVRRFLHLFDGATNNYNFRAAAQKAEKMHLVHPLVDIDDAAALQAVKDEFKTYCEAVGILDYELIPTSTLPDTAQQTRKNAKHSKRTFVLNECVVSGSWHSIESVASENWELVDDLPDNPVFCIINRFEPVNGAPSSFRRMQERLKAIKQYKKDFEYPEIYGVKTTAKKPVGPEDVEGVTFDAWSMGILRELTAPGTDLRDLLHLLHWEDIRSSRARKKFDYELKLGTIHPLTLLVSEADRNLKRISKMTPKIKGPIEKLEQLVGSIDSFYAEDKTYVPVYPTPADKAVAALYARYPLAESLNFRIMDIGSQYGEIDAWVDYIKMMDELHQCREKQNNE